LYALDFWPNPLNLPILPRPFNIELEPPSEPKISGCFGGSNEAVDLYHFGKRKLIRIARRVTPMKLIRINLFHWSRILMYLMKFGSLSIFSQEYKW
jgi:hypothetical protein